ncbi:hypothetical protein [Neisseria animalis]|nr:hypothetical protein [Neisseria animalis]VEE07086.1 Uncharacterised protein [Neisseria animalis]
MKKLIGAGVLSMAVLLSGCSASLPSCSSSDAKQLIKQLVNQGNAKLLLGDFVEVRDIDEEAYNRDSEIRVCSAMLVTTKTTEAISYSIKWQNKDNGMFYLEIN